MTLPAVSPPTPSGCPIRLQPGADALLDLRAEKLGQPPRAQGPSQPESRYFTEKPDNVGHCMAVSVPSTMARDSFFLRVFIGSRAPSAPLLRPLPPSRA